MSELHPEIIAARISADASLVITIIQPEITYGSSSISEGIHFDNRVQHFAILLSIRIYHTIQSDIRSVNEPVRRMQFRLSHRPPIIIYQTDRKSTRILGIHIRIIMNMSQERPHIKYIDG